MLPKISIGIMIMMEDAGFEELEHTADWELRVWAPDLSVLLGTAARGMYHLMGVVSGDFLGEIQMDVSGFDEETILVTYLSELLLLGEEEGLMLGDYFPMVEGFRVQANVPVFAIVSQEKEIKAVTYHRMQVKQVSLGMETTIVFDV